MSSPSDSTRAGEDPTVRRLVVPFVVPPYPLRRGYRDFPDFVLLHSAIRRSELQWRDRYGSAGGVDVVAAHQRALREREASRPAARMPLRGTPVPGACNWTFLGPRNVGGRVTGITVHPTNADRLWVGTADGGVWRSDDAGESWTAMFDDQDSLSIGALAVAPSDGQRLYVGTGESNSNYDELPGTGVYRSDDGGDTWTRVATVSQLAPRISAVWVHPTDRDVVLVGSPGGGGGSRGLWRSTDGGATWSVVLNEVVWDIGGRDPPNANAVYCAVSSTGGVIRKSTDGGRTWTTPSPGLVPQATGGATISIDRVAVGVAGGTSNRVYARACVNWVNMISGTATTESHGWVYRSDDGGRTWTSGVDDGAGYLGSYANALTVRPDDPDVVLTGSLNTARSADGATTFALTGTDTGFGWRQEHYSGPVDLHADVHALAYGPRSNPDRAYLGGDGGVYVSHFDAGGVDGQAWVKRNHGLNVTQFGYVGVSPTAPSMIGGGTQDNGTPRTLGGLTWRTVYGGDGGIFEVNPTNTAECFFQYVSGDLRRSIDGGRSQVPWTTGLNLDTEDVGWLNLPFAFDPDAASTKYAATSRVYQSVDDGEWTPISEVLTEAADDSGWNPLNVLTVDPANPTVLWAGDRNGRVFRADSPAASAWQEKTGAAFPTAAIRAIEITRAGVYVGLGGVRSGGKVFYTANSGDDWTDITGNLPSAAVQCLAVDPFDTTSQTIYAGTDVGVFRTTDRGSQWAVFDAGLPLSGVHGLSIDPSAGMLRCATHGRGMWEIPIGPGAVVCRDRQLYVRSSPLDAGRGITPSDAPDPIRPGGRVYWWQSPDIKVDAEPFQKWTHVVDGSTVQVDKLDGVIFDAELVHEYPRRGRTARVYAQVHNRGPLPITRVAVRLFYADATAGLPAVPDGFFAGFPTWATQAGQWTAVGPAQIIDTLAPGTPDVRRFDWAVPTAAATHSCMLMLITSDDDPITATGTSVDAAIPTSRHLALLNLHVIDYGELGKPGDDDPAAITDDNAPVPSAAQIKMHNGTDDDHEYTLRLNWAGSGPLNVALALPPRAIDTVDIDRGTRQPLPDTALAANRQPLKGLDEKRWVTGAGPEFTVKGLVIQAHRFLPIAVLAAPAPGAQIGREQRVDIVQLLDGAVVGGSTLLVRSGTERQPPPVTKHVRITLTGEARAVGSSAASPLRWSLAIGIRRRPRLTTGIWRRPGKPITLYDGDLGPNDWLELRGLPLPDDPFRPPTLRPRIPKPARRLRLPEARLIVPPPVWDGPRRHTIRGPGWSAQLAISVTDP